MNLRLIAALLLAAYAVFGLPAIDLKLPAKPVTPVSPVVPVTPEADNKTPEDQMKQAVMPVVRVVSKMSIDDRLWLQSIYENMSRVVTADGIINDSSITTTGDLRAVHVLVLRFVWKGMASNSPDKYPGLKAAIEQAVTDTLGSEDRQMTPELRRKAAEVFNAIAWAGLGRDS
jgi:hypothetical protein